jgi:predicted TIM-barrel fold metal-dependent hydrolase
MIIDAHVHLWSHDHAHFPDRGWTELRDSGLPKADGTAERLVALMDAAGVAFALNVQVPWYGEECRFPNHQRV